MSMHDLPMSVDGVLPRQALLSSCSSSDVLTPPSDCHVTPPTFADVATETAVDVGDVSVTLSVSVASVSATLSSAVDNNQAVSSLVRFSVIHLRRRKIPLLSFSIHT